PDAVVHLAAVAAIAEAHRDPPRALRVNRDGARHLAELCAASGAALVHVSTDLVFDGEKGGYGEEDDARPRSVYGVTKLESERAVQTIADANAAVLRLSL